MPTPDYILKLRAKVGHTLLLVPGVTAIVLNEKGEVLLQRRSDDGQRQDDLFHTAASTSPSVPFCIAASA